MTTKDDWKTRAEAAERQCVRNARVELQNDAEIRTLREKLDAAEARAADADELTAVCLDESRERWQKAESDRDEWKARAEALRAENERLRSGQTNQPVAPTSECICHGGPREDCPVPGHGIPPAAPTRTEQAQAENERLWARVAELDLQASTLLFSLSVEMPSEYRPRTVGAKLGYLVEECGEVLAAVGKTQRWGLDSFNPELPEGERETNRAWLLRELHDLKRAIYFIETTREFLGDEH